MSQLPESTEELCSIVNSFARTDCVSSKNKEEMSPSCVVLQIVEDPRLEFCLQVKEGGFSALTQADVGAPKIRTSWLDLLAFLTGDRSYAELVLNGDWQLLLDRMPLQLQERVHAMRAIDQWASLIKSPHSPASDLRDRVARLSERLEPMEEIPHISEVDIAAFQNHFMSQGRPVILEGACRSWSFAELIEAYEGARFPFHDYAMKGVLVGDVLRRLAAGLPIERTLSLPLSVRVRRSHWSIPLMDHFKVFEAARRVIFGYADVCPVEGGYRNATVWHCDLAHNFLSQLTGSKRVLLVAPHKRKAMRIQRTIPALVDNVEWDVSGGISLKDVKVMECTLTAGDILFLPCGWFHNVVNLKPSCVMTSWILEACG